ncbi:MAG: oligosaccharide flippase family protein [Roseburia sp.]|nr:oligosaccharide flippase family protein [Roseburia sp.]MCM1557382.1 oligosaccharide flippase family protein [Anaeroplasma bactoclasticum]
MKEKIQKLLTKYKSMPTPLKSSLWYTICNFFNKGIALLSLPIFTRILSQEEYGTYTIFQSWYSIFVIFASLNIYMSSYSKGLLIYKDDRQRFTSSLLGLTTTITMFLGIIYVSFMDYWTSIIKLSPILMGAMFLELLFVPAYEFWAARERFDFKYIKYVIVSIALSILTVAGAAVAVLLTSYKVEAKIYTEVIIKCVFFIFLFVMLICNGKCFFNKKYWKYALIFNLPLIPHYLSTFILNQADRIMIGNLVGNAEAGMYGVAYSISNLMFLLVNAINFSLVPYIYKKINNNEYEAIKKNTGPLFFIVSLLCVITMLFAPEVVFIFGGDKYMDAKWVIPSVSASVYFIFLYSMFSNLEYYYKKTWQISVASIICAGLNIGLNYVFIPKFGYYAAGYTTLVSYVLLALCHFAMYKWVLKKEIKTIKNLYNMYFLFFSSLFVLVSMFFIIFTYNYIYIRYSLIVVILILGIIFRKKIITLIKNIMVK